MAPCVSLLAPGLDRGGMTRAYAIAAALRHAGCEVEVIGALGRGASVYPDPPSGLRVVPVTDGPFIKRVRATARVARGDVLYAIKPRVTSFGVALLSRRGRPVFLDIDDVEAAFAFESQDPESRVRWLRKSVRRSRNLDHASWTRQMEHWIGRASAVTASTALLANRFAGVYLPSARDTDHFDPAIHDPDASRRELGLEGMRVVMFPGTPREHKGVQDAAEALEMLAWDDARLVLVGGRDAGNRFSEALARQYPARVKRLARFASQDMPRVVAAAHVVAVPQRDTSAARGQFPMKLTDAMAMAKPIVSTRVGEIPDALEGAAWLVEPSSPRAIAEAISEVFENPEEAARRGQRARQVCIERFSTRAAAGILAALLERHLPSSKSV